VFDDDDNNDNNDQRSTEESSFKFKPAASNVTEMKRRLTITTGIGSRVMIKEMDTS
jgi:hypothetical protein